MVCEIVCLILLNLLLCESKDQLIVPTNLSNHIIHDFSWRVKMLLLKDYFKGLEPKEIQHHNRRVGIQSLIQRAPEDQHNTKPNDENSMRLKLFGLMYETVRDSDLKAKRAELIRTHYTNNSLFDIGYILGDVNDKFNIMSDIASTLKRMFNEWKPIDHINAYEQISNQAIEINHLVDMAITTDKQSIKVENKDENDYTV